MQKRWRCKVCGYVHRGEIAPEVCPVCGVGAEKFTEMAEEGDGEPVSKAEKGLLQEMIDSFVPHAVAAHFPNALLPTLALFLLLYLVFGLTSLDHGVYLLLGLIPLSALATLVTGIYSWRHNYDGAKSLIFHRKLFFGVCLVLISFEMLLLRYANPEIFSAPGGQTWFFLVLTLAALFCVAMLGHYGSMLVFGRIWKDRKYLD